MNSKRTGIVILVVSLVLLAVFVLSFQDKKTEANELGCFDAEGCGPLQQSLSLIHLGFGLFGFILALGFYLVFFSKGDEFVVKTLDKHTTKLDAEEKWKILYKGLDEAEQEVIGFLRDADGMMQNSLAVQVSMSKAKLSQVLGMLEKKGLLKKKPHKKTNTLHLSVDFGE